MIYLNIIALIVVGFLIQLNGFLRGAWKEGADLTLGLLLVGLLVAPFLLSGWEFAVLAGVALVVSSVLSRPLAAWTASRILSGPSGNSGIGYQSPPRMLQTISRELGKQVSTEEFMEDLLSGHQRKAAALEKLINYCESKPDIRRVMQKHQLSREDLEELYSTLCRGGAGQWTCGHWVAASTLAYAESLEYFVCNRDSDPIETVYNLLMYFEQGTELPEIAN